MATVTWSTAPVPLRQVRVGDRVQIHGRLLPVTATVKCAGEVLLYAADGDTKVELAVDGSQTIDTHVPDEPVDGYGLWKPKPGVWSSGCVCVIRSNPKMPGNWETVARDETCRGHYDWNDYED